MEDYVPVTQTLLFDQLTSFHNVPISMATDNFPELMETLSVKLSLQTNVSNVLLIPSEAKISIQDDDSKLHY